MLYEKIKLNKFTDSRGELIYGEWNDKNNSFKIPFEVKRFYVLSFKEQDTIRGEHAHTDGESVLVCLNGKITVLVDNALGNKDEIELSNSEDALYIKDPVWRVIKAKTANCIMLVLNSQNYHDIQYIRDYDEFVNYMQKQDS